VKHLRKIVEGSIVWAPGVSGAVVLSDTNCAADRNGISHCSRARRHR
jgi:hypothetical protein